MWIFVGFFFAIIWCLLFSQESMGFEQGRGLGRFGQGRADIIETSQQRGRRGLGFRVDGFDDKNFTWEEEDKVRATLLCVLFMTLSWLLQIMELILRK